MSETQKAELIGEVSDDRNLVVVITNADNLICVISPDVEDHV